MRMCDLRECTNLNLDKFTLEIFICERYFGDALQ